MHSNLKFDLKFELVGKNFSHRRDNPQFHFQVLLNTEAMNAVGDYTSGDLAALFAGSDGKSDVVAELFASTKVEERNAEASADEEREGEELEKEDVGKEKETERVKMIEPALREAAAHERTVFVGNLPLHLRKESGEELPLDFTKLKKALKKWFAAFGKVQSVRIRSVPIEKTKIPSKGSYKTMHKVAVIKNKVNENRKTCNAYVVFETEDAASRAVTEGHDCEFHGFHLRVDKVTDSKPIFEPKRTSFLGNISAYATDEDVREFFQSREGFDVENIRLVRDRNTQLCKGVAYVLFRSPSMAKQALRLNGEQFLERPLRISRCENPGKLKQEKGSKKRGASMHDSNKHWYKERKLGSGPADFRGAKAVFQSTKPQRKRGYNKKKKSG